jgi:hypothetical protein
MTKKDDKYFSLGKVPIRTDLEAIDFAARITI